MAYKSPDIDASKVEKKPRPAKSYGFYPVEYPLSAKDLTSDPRIFFERMQLRLSGKMVPVILKINRTMDFIAEPTAWFRDARYMSLPKQSHILIDHSKYEERK